MPFPIEQECDKTRKKQKSDLNSPTAACLRVVHTIKSSTKTTLNPQAMMFAMFPKEPSVLTSGMPHSGLMPTGADEELAERPELARVEGDSCCSCEGEGMSAMLLYRRVIALGRRRE